MFLSRTLLSGSWEIWSRVLKLRFGFFLFWGLIPQSYSGKMKVNSLEEVKTSPYANTATHAM